MNDMAIELEEREVLVVWPHYGAYLSKLVVGEGNRKICPVLKLIFAKRKIGKGVGIILVVNLIFHRYTHS